MLTITVYKRTLECIKGSQIQVGLSPKIHKIKMPNYYA